MPLFSVSIIGFITSGFCMPTHVSRGRSAITRKLTAISNSWRRLVPGPLSDTCVVKFCKSESVFSKTPWILAGVFFLISTVFVWRSFYAMRIPVEATRAGAAVPAK